MLKQLSGTFIRSFCALVLFTQRNYRVLVIGAVPSSIPLPPFFVRAHLRFISAVQYHRARKCSVFSPDRSTANTKHGEPVSSPETNERWRRSVSNGQYQTLTEDAE